MKPVALLLPTIAFSLLLVGCDLNSGDPRAGDGPDSQSPGSAGSPTVAAYDAAYRQMAPSPIQHYRIPASESHVIQSAERALAHTCMARYGFDVPGLTYDREYAIAEQREADLNQYGLNDIERARVYGYNDAFLAQSKVNPEPPVDKTPTYLVAMVGYTVASTLDRSIQRPQGSTFLPDGCIGAARSKIWGQPVPPANQIARDIYFGSHRKAEADPRVVGLFAEWSSCMQGRGYSFVHPFDPMETTWGAPPEGATVSDAEINAAVADVECKRSVDLVPKWSAIVAEYQTKGIEEHALELTEARAKIDAALKNANEVLATAQE